MKTTLSIDARRRSAAIVLSALLLVFSDIVSSPAGDFPWPIRSPRSISSTFGEPRPGRFHLGMDFKSGGVTGKKVIAVGDGYIFRVKTSPFGYGKALYLKLDTGQIVVYGHLSEFLPEIEDILFSMRIQRKTYDINWYPEPGRFRVKRGQVIAYSGDTGSGPAHLHLEIRDENNVPENPLDYGFDVRDSIPPIIESVMFIPLDGSSSVNGIPCAVRFDAPPPEGVPVVLTGKIGVAVSTYDRVDISNNRLGVYSLSLDVDSTRVFEKIYRKIPYEEDRFGGFDILSPKTDGGNGYLTVLFRRKGNGLSIYRGDGVLSEKTLTDGAFHTVTVRAEDHEGNTAESSFEVLFSYLPFLTRCELRRDRTIHVAGRSLAGNLERVELWRETPENGPVLERTAPVGGSSCELTMETRDSAPVTYRVVLVAENGLRSPPAFLQAGEDEPGDAPSGGLRVRTELKHDRVVVHVSSDELPSSIPKIRVERNGVPADGFLSLVPEKDRSWVTSLGFPRTGRQVMRITASAVSSSFRRTEGSAEIDFTAVGNDSTVTVVSTDGLLALTVRPGNLYRPAPVSVDTASVETENGLFPVSRGYRITWGDSPLRKPCDVAITIDVAPADDMALYASGNGDGDKWRFISDDHEGIVFTGKIGGSCYVAVLADPYAPYVAAASPRPGSTVKTGRPLLAARVEDRGSGIEGSDSIEMSIDGIPIYGEYDYEGHRVRYRPHNPLKPGKHTVRVAVTDRAGNVRSVSWKFRVVD